LLQKEKTSVFGKMLKFLKEVKVEMGKVSWPTREELISSTAVVVVVSLMFAVIVGALDTLLMLLAKSLYGS
jgi:preprotein translocase subunit SecE